MDNGLQSLQHNNEVFLNSYQLHLPIKANSPRPRGLSRKRKPAPAKVAHAREKQDLSPRLKQSALPFKQGTPEEKVELLRRRIQAHTEGELNLIVTDNRSSIITVKRVGGVYKVRLHRMFLWADHTILKALGRYIDKADVSSGEILEKYIEKHVDFIRESPVQRPQECLYQKGQYHDLQEIYDVLNRRYFGGGIHAKISWGKELSGPPRHHRSVKMGTYSLEERIIRIHKSLDREFVPRYFLESVIFHEMLHQRVGVTVVNGRNQYHTEEFLEWERRYEHRLRAKTWEKENITRLLYF